MEVVFFEQFDLAEGGGDESLGVVVSVFFDNIFGEGAGVDADADGNAGIFGGFGDLGDFPVGSDVAGIDADFIDALFDGFQREFVFEVNIGDERQGDSFFDFGQF